MEIVTLGELLIDMFPGQVGQKMGEVESFIPKPGGAPANVAVAVKRLGAQSAFIGKVGDDLFGHYLKGVLEAEQVDTRGIRFDHEARTTMAMIAMPDENSAEFVFYRNPGADQRLKPEELDRELIASAKVFHFGSLSLTDQPSRSATQVAVKAARNAGCLVSYDVNYRPALWQDTSEAVVQAKIMITQVDLLKVNEQEISLLTGKELIDLPDLQLLDEAASELLEQGPALVVVTLGREGSYFQSEQGSAYVPAFRVDSIDATGCGDAFIAGLLVQLVREENWQDTLNVDMLRQKLRYANAVGALTSLSRGVIPALPYAQTVDQFLAKQPQV